MENTNIIAYFNEDILDPKEVCILGIDNGAGEYAGSIARFRGDRLELRNLSTSNTNTNDYIYVALNDERQVIGVEALEYEGEIYTNFKVTPERSEEKFGKKLQESYTYKYLIGKAFFYLIRDILVHNKDIIVDYDGKAEKHVYLFVGRPSSNAWENQSRKYRDILKQYLLQLKEVILDAQTRIRVKFHIIVYSEAMAAMAYEYFNKKNVKEDEVIAVIDGGSSTFDCVVVKDGEVINEYSRQVGAGMIDKNMLDIFLLDEENARLPVNERRAAHDKMIQEIADNEGRATLQLRQRKENYFGPNGNNGDDMARHAVFRSGKRVIKNIDQSFMRLAIEQMPVRVERSYIDEKDAFGGNKTQDYNSFYEAIEFFCKGAKARCTDKKSNKEVKLDRIILTGGATVMPFVQEIVERVFEVQKNKIKLEKPDDNRHFSVAKGLAYMGYAELTRQKELKVIQEKIDLKIRNIMPEVVKQVRNTCMAGLWNQIYEINMLLWAAGTSEKSVSDWENMKHDIPVDTIIIDLKKFLEDRKVTKSINDALDAHFKKLFPNSDRKYEFEIKQTDILASFGNCLRQIKTKPKNMFGAMQRMKNYFGTKNAISPDKKLTSAERQTIQNRIKKRKADIKEDLKLQIEAETTGLESLLYHTMTENINNSLEAYMDGLMPYFVREAADVAND